MTDKIGKAHALKRGIVRDFQDVRGFQRFEEFVWQRFTTGQVNGYYRPIVKGVGQQQDLEVRRVAVPVHAAIGEWG